MKNSKYAILILIGGALYGTMSSFVKLSYTLGYSAAELAFFQALFAAIFLGTFLWVKRGHERKMSRKQIVSLLATGGAIGLTNFLYYASVSYIPASLAIIILMQFTWFSLFMEWAVFRKKASALELITVAFILLGTIMAGGLRGAQGISIPTVGIVLALLSSLTYATYIVANSRVGKNIEWLPKSTLIMTGSALMIFTFNANAIMNFDYMGFGFLLIAVFLAVFGTTIPTALFAAGIPKAGAGISSILMTVELPVALVCANLILHEHMSLLQYGGIVIMLGAISIMNYYRSPRD